MQEYREEKAVFNSAAHTEQAAGTSWFWTQLPGQQGQPLLKHCI